MENAKIFGFPENRHRMSSVAQASQQFRVNEENVNERNLYFSPFSNVLLLGIG